jgi:alpha-galactosidase
VKRRGLLRASIGTAALALVRHGQAGSLPTALATLQVGATRYVVALRRSGLGCHCLPPGAVFEPDGDAPARDLAVIAAGPHRVAVAWRLGSLRQDSPDRVDVTLAAEDVPLSAEITIEIDRPSGLLTRRTTLRHTGEGPDVDIRGTLSAALRLHEPIDQILYLTGAWGEESRVRRARPAPLVLESQAGKTGFAFQPYLSLRAGAATYVCELMWSGNWRLEVVPDSTGAEIFGGFNDTHFHDSLAPGETLELPAIAFGRIEGNTNRATQALHDYRRARRPNPDRPIPVQYNTWYALKGEPTARIIRRLIPVAARLGCEAFVVDAGWFRAGDQDIVAGWEDRTGDWFTSHLRFPNGLREVADLTRAHGLRFGLWFEPELIGSISLLPRQHPDWLHHVGGALPGTNGRAVLNLGVPAARDYVVERLSQIIAGVGIGWVKWDFNSDLGLGGWAPGLPAELTREDPIVAHYRGLYTALDDVRRRFPDLIMETCASGAGRMDGAILSHAHVNWISDQPAALRKLAIHFGCQLAHPAVVCNDWLVEWPPVIPDDEADDPASLARLGDLPFRLRVAMLGSFGISARADHWAAADLDIAAAHIALYRDHLRPIIHHGDQYLLTRGPRTDGTGDWCAVLYLTKDRTHGALFVFRLGGADTTRTFDLPDLDAGETYRFTTLDTSIIGGTKITVAIPHRYHSELYRIEKI